MISVTRAGTVAFLTREIAEIAQYTGDFPTIADLPEARQALFVITPGSGVIALRPQYFTQAVQSTRDSAGIA